MRRRSLLSFLAAAGLGACDRGAGRAGDAPASVTQSPAPAPRASAAANGRSAVVVELFTSEGCSSCPPADALLDELVRTQPIAGVQVIGLELHVDYWDYLGWKDPFSSADHTERQQRYAATRGDGRTFTPEAVVGGRESLVGSQRGKLLAAIERAAAVASMALQLRCEGARASVTLDREPPRAADLVVALLERGLVSRPTRGENSGETLRHAPVARWLERAGEAHAGAHTIALPDARGELIAFVQARDDLAVLAATTGTCG